MDPLAKRFERYRRHGDIQALGEVFDALAPRLLPVAMHLCGAAAAAEDALQETFVLAIERADAFDAARRLEPWLVGLLTNVARSARRNEARRAARPLPEMASDEPEPIATAERAELVALLRTQVDTLPPEQRQVLRLQLVHGMAPVEIAEVLEVPAGTVRMRIHRGLAALRRLLPAGLAVAMFATLPTRGLAAVKQAVMHAGRARLVASGVAAVGTSVVVAGGMVAMKKLLAALAVVVLFGVWWLGMPMLVPAPAAPPSPAANATPARAAGGAADAGDAAASPREEAPAAMASLLGSLRIQAAAMVGAAELPLAGAFLEAWPGESPMVPFDDTVVHATTDPAGHALLADLAPGPWRVQIVTGNRPVTHAVMIEAGREAVLRIERKLRGVVRGIVVDADGLTVAGAQVWVYRGVFLGANSRPDPAEIESRLGAVTASDGRFEVAATSRESDASQERWVGASCAGHGESFGYYLNAGGADQGEVRIVLGRAHSTIGGTVRDEHGAALAGVFVRLLPAGRDTRRAADGDMLGPRVVRSVRTDAQGRFRFDGVAPGKVRVWSTAWPRIQGAAEVEAQPFGTADVVLTMAAGTMVVGTVRNADGTPARVKVFSAPKLPATGSYCECDTREDGSYLLHYQPGERFFVCVGMHGAPLVTRECMRPENGLLRCDFVLAGRATVRGRVLGPDGAALADWTVVANGDTPNSSCTWTAADGGFTIAVPIGVACELATRAPGMDETEPAARATVAAGATACDLRVAAAAIPSATVRGRLVDANERAVAGTLVVLVVGGRELGNRWTTADGAFAFASLPAGAWDLDIDGVRVATSPRLELRAGETRDCGNIVDPRAACLDIELVRADGTAWRGPLPYVEVKTAAGEELRPTREPNSGGVRMRLVPGAYRVEVKGTDLIAAPQTLELAVGTRRLRCEVAIGRSRELVCNGDGVEKPARGTALHVVVRSADGTVLVLRDASQDWTLRGFWYWELDHVFALGRYEVEAHTDAGWHYRGTFEVRDDLDDPTRVDIPRSSR